MAARSPTHRLLVALFFVSGAAALVYEHLLQKLLGRALGTSAAGTAAVLAAYMGGLGLGSLLGGRLAARARRPWRAYALVEAGAALAALAAPHLLGGVIALYVALAGGRAGALLVAARFVVAALVAVPPALVAGMTFPFGARLIAAESPEGETGRRLGALYGANTLGAAAGVLASTYALVPLLGTSRALFAAAAGNLALAAAALLQSRRGERKSETDFTFPAKSEGDFTITNKRETDFTLGRWPTLLGAFGSGALGLALEVVWFRLLAVVVGASVFAFVLMLFAFLVGTGLGGAWSARGRLGRAGAGALVALQLAASAVILMTLPLWDRVPSVFVVLGRLEPGFALTEAVRLACALALLLPPTVLLGAAFPLLFRLGQRAGEAPKRVARVYALDTVGAVAGALGASFVLLPLAGARAALIVLALASAALAAVYASSLPPSARRRAWAAALCVPLAGAIVPRWNLARLASGSNAYLQEGFRDYDRLLFADEDAATGLVTVVEKAGTRTLLTNGKFEGNDGFEVRDQYLFSLLPLLFVHRYDAALNIGVGTGATLRVMAAFPFRRLEAVDLSRAILAAARRWFQRINGGVLDGARAEILVDDGRNRLLTTRLRYDLISVELSSIWLSGTGELYNREFYELARARLAPGGVLQQWVQLHHISRRDLASVLYTLRSVFPHVTLWVSGHQGVLVASVEPLTVEPRALAELPGGALGEVTRSCGLLDPLSALGHLYLDTDDVDRLTADVAAAERVAPAELTSTDDSSRLEYSTPRGNLLARAFADNLQLVRRYAMTRLAPLLDGADPSLRELAQAYAAHERGWDDLAREHARKAGAGLDGARHAPLRRALGLD
ncbi:MAG TPA: fused MFS/spermidine synthase [Polyangia bacterium]|nr:fused MFS/spermidine synthase [Polyangia bacterium]